MAKFQSPLLGYNNNVRHKGRVFHIQTEDSGVNHPHIITHLFMDGGRILKSVKRSYAEHVGAEKMSDTVRVLMKEQHKAMFVALRAGDFDHIVDPGSVVAKAAAPVAADAPAPVVVPPPPPPPPVAAESIPPPTEASPTGPSSAPSTQPSAASPEVTETAAWGVSRDDSSVEVSVAEAEISIADLDLLGDLPPSAPVGPEPLPASEGAPKTTREPELRRPSAEELTLDFDALERDLESNVNPMFQGAELPPPPANLFASSRAEPGTGKYRTAAMPPEDPPPASPQRFEQPSRPPRSERYVSSRPAAIFGVPAKPSAAPPSIFGDDLVSDKSLDEVILSYLAEDLDPPRRK